MSGDPIPKLAVLIDADNARHATISLLLAEVAKYGTAHVKRAYGDWTSSNMNGWKNELLIQSIQPIQQFAYTTGKNSTDSAMIIDAMDLLYTNRFDGFCIVSSDSDYTRLAARIRESGMTVYGFGEHKTPKPFVSACDKFIYNENLVNLEELVPHADNGVAHKHNPPVQKPLDSEHLKNQLRTTVETASDDDGWARLCTVGQLLTTQYPDFDPRTYRYSKLSDLIIASSLFEVARRPHRQGLPSEFWVRDKRRREKKS
ncbi:uncharacterized protein N7498_010821 [Penicillium cinerascens]|uniref:HTH OST-type domain-containing protein n=1 Tax=Penicillium cinerascens TaxID=70096 RepID=A0A9W9JCK4_9EURO|nr:uncharacterized protein N7498_010821 [Penicillium cinerascens]KAJ5191836.1 hypothetical protein N7498_010821 [Penicillium cinerascens]